MPDPTIVIMLPPGSPAPSTVAATVIVPGPIGPPGQIGQPGTVGDRGPQGLQGLQGLQGPPGTAGGAQLDSPAFTGTPTAPTAAPGTDTTQIASTAFVANAVLGATGGTANGVTGVIDPSLPPFSVPADGSTDSQPGLQAILDTYLPGQPLKIKLGPKHYAADRPIRVSRNDVTIEGEGVSGSASGLSQILGTGHVCVAIGDLADAATDGFKFSTGAGGGRPLLSSFLSGGVQFVDSTVASFRGFSTQGGRTYLIAQGTAFDLGVRDATTQQFDRYGSLTGLTIEWMFAPGQSGTLAFSGGAAALGIGDFSLKPLPWYLAFANVTGQLALAFALAGDTPGRVRQANFPFGTPTVPHRGRFVLDFVTGTATAVINGATQAITWGNGGTDGTGLTGARFVPNDLGSPFILGYSGLAPQIGNATTDFVVLGFRVSAGVVADAGTDDGRFATKTSSTIAALDIASAVEPDRFMKLLNNDPQDWATCPDALGHQASISGVVLKDFTLQNGLLMTRFLDCRLDNIDCRNQGGYGLVTPHGITSYTLGVRDCRFGGAEAATHLYDVTAVFSGVMRCESNGNQVIRNVGCDVRYYRLMMEGFGANPDWAIACYGGNQGGISIHMAECDNESSTLQKGFLYAEPPSSNFGHITLDTVSTGPLAAGAAFIHFSGPKTRTDAAHTLTEVNARGLTCFGGSAPMPLYADCFPGWLVGTVSYLAMPGAPTAGGTGVPATNLTILYGVTP